MTSVPRLFPGSTVAILAGGPSLTQADVDACRGKVRVLAIKDAIRMAPWADCLYACDAKWFKYYGPTLNYPGPRYSLEVESDPWAQVLRNTGPLGLEIDPSGLRTGKNSGFQSVNLARHLGAKRILLLGYDMQPSAKGKQHWFPDHPYGATEPPYKAFLDCWPSIVEPLRREGIDVVNCTPGSALREFPMMSLSEALAMEAVTA